MSAPVLTHTGQRLYDALEPFAYDDANQDYALAHLCGAIAACFDPVADLTRDQDDGTPGWAIVFDPDLCPAYLLPWAAQFVGVEMLPGMTEAQMRIRYRETAGFRRGTVDAIKGAARQYLTGAGYVNVIERYGGDAYKYLVVTRTAETPLEPAGTWDTGSGGYSWDSVPATVTWDTASLGGGVFPGQVYRALLEQKPAGLKFSLVVATSQLWDEASAVTWNGVGGGLTWDDLLTSSI